MYRLAIIAGLFYAASAQADSFDLRSMNVVTPIRSQVVGFDHTNCWAFAACSALETDYMLTTGKSLDYLSPAYVTRAIVPNSITATVMQNAVTDLAASGTVLESVSPLTSGTADLTLPYTVYRATSCDTNLSGDTASLKAWMRQHGEIITELTNDVYTTTWYYDGHGNYTSVDTNVFSPEWSIWGNHPVQEIADNARVFTPNGSTISSCSSVAYIAYADDWHVVDLVGYEDDAAWPGGGYWIVKSSYPASIGPWIPGPDGYGQISYAALADNGTLSLAMPSQTRRFMGFDGPAGSETFNADGTLSFQGTWIVQPGELPDGVGITVGDSSAFASQAAAVPEPQWLAVAALALLMFVILRSRP